MDANLPYVVPDDDSDEDDDEGDNNEEIDDAQGLQGPQLDGWQYRRDLINIRFAN